MSDTEAMPTTMSVGAVAALVGVSVRTLHHWDQIGLVRPKGRTFADYRVYSSADITRIQRVLVYREAGFPLAEVGRLLDDPDLDEAAHLRRQRELLVERIAHLQEMVSAVDTMMEAVSMGSRLTPAEKAEIFGKDWQPEYETEAEQRWGDSPQWAQSQQRAAALSKEDWQQVKAEGDALDSDLAQALRDGVEPGSAEANALAERHRVSIEQFFDCTYSMQVCLGKMYLGDSRFTQRYEDIQPGLTQWLYDAIAANAKAHGVDPDTAVWE